MSHRPNVRPLSPDERRKLRAGIVRRVESDVSIRSFHDIAVAFNRPVCRLVEALDPKTLRRLSHKLAERRPGANPYEDATQGPSRRRVLKSWRQHRAAGRARRQTIANPDGEDRHLNLDEMKAMARSGDARVSEVSEVSRS
jgi:hypothetical protein